jgi:lysophospholipase L1-like esterase
MKNVFRGVAALTLSTVTLLSFATFVTAGAPTAGADTPVSAFYLAIGGSASLGVQPIAGYPKGQRTDEGYADYLVAQEAAKGVSLDLHEIGCSGETTNDMVHGGDKCYAFPETQLNQALSFLQSHHDDNGLVTIDLGFNDVLPCLNMVTTDERCVTRQLITVRQQLTQIIGLLEVVAGPNVKFVGVGHYDPFLAKVLNNPKHADAANRSLRQVRHLDQVLSGVYQSFGIPLAEVGQAFKFNNTTPVAIAGLGVVPENVAQVCLLTWMCQPGPLGPNIHPNAAGYAVIAEAIEDVLTPW